mmetsp:Transcript_8006/g.14415  ORF Transcript_8006/g.14415 Transcript_8006/m.14415 type:complete len:239 (-) Transcript_8006:1591-2307(-)
MLMPQIIEMLTLPLQHHLAKPIALHGSPIKCNLIQLGNPRVVNCRLRVPRLPLFILLPIGVNPIVQSRPAHGIRTNDDVPMFLPVQIQILIMLLPIGIDPGEHIRALLDNVRSGSHGIKVESDLVEFGEANGVDTLASGLVVELALASDPIAKLDILATHTTNQTITMLSLIRLQLLKLLVPFLLKPPIVIIFSVATLQGTEVKPQRSQLCNTCCRQSGMFALLELFVLLSRFQDEIS